MNSLSRTLLPAAAFMLATGGATTSAALLVYEPFAYTAGATLDTITPNASTIGLSQTTPYSGMGAVGYTVQASSLTFAGIEPVGGSVRFATGTNVASGLLDIGTTPHTGDLYLSYLVSLSARGSATGDGATIRVADNNSSSGDRFNAQADSRQGSTDVGINYGQGTSGTTNSGEALALNTTYLIIARFTNVGLTLTPSTPGVASIYALTPAQYASFQAAGATQSYLDTATEGTGASQIAARGIDPDITTGGPFTFESGDFFALVGVNGTGTFDEVRYGGALTDVIPEPASAALLAMGAAAPVLFRRRRNR